MVILYHHPDAWLISYLTNIATVTIGINLQDQDRFAFQDQVHCQLNTSHQCGEGYLEAINILMKQYMVDP
jgi:gluconate kinase